MPKLLSSIYELKELASDTMMKCESNWRIEAKLILRIAKNLFTVVGIAGHA